jgi:hypothetical protein
MRPGCPSTRSIRRWLAVSIIALPAILAFSSSALAETVTMRTNGSGVFTNPCNQESFPFTSVTEITFHTSTDESGGVHVYLHNISIDIAGVAPLSGTLYIGHADIRNIFQSMELGVSFTSTNETTAVINGTGPTDDFFAHALVHMTFKDGVLLSQTVLQEMDCKG